MLLRRSPVTAPVSNSLCLFSPVQDGYTLERVDVYGLVDGVHETVLIPGAECYVGRKDNPSFSQCGLLLSLSPLGVGSQTSVSHFPLSKKKTFAHVLDSQVGSEKLDVLTDTIWHAVGLSGPNKVRYCAL
jgi:hypothetical protein